MVVFVDLDNDVSDDPHADPNEPRGFSSLRKHRLGDKVTANAPPNGNDGNSEERPNPNINSFSAALGAYPYICPPSGIPQFITQLTDIPPALSPS